MSNLPDYTGITHSLFGQVRHYNRITSGYIEYEVSASSQQITTWQNLLRLYKPLNSDGLFIPENYDRLSSTKLKIGYADFGYLLDQEKNNRIRLNNLRFEKNELWYMLFTLLETCHFCSKMNYHLGEVCGGNILFNQYGRLKVFNALSVPNFQSYIQKKTLRKSPEMYQAGDNSTLIHALNRQKSQSFSIAMTMIEIALLCSLEGLYINFGRMNEQIKKHLEDVKTVYGDFFVSILADMLIMDPIQRSSSVQMYAILKPYSDKIVNLESFIPDPQISLASLKSYLSEDRHS